MGKSKRARHEKEIALEKKRRRTRRITLIAFVAVILVIAAYGIFNMTKSVDAEIYSDNGQTLQLLSDGTFTATLSHGASYSGTYTKIEQGDITLVAFSSGGETVYGEIEDGQLHIPHEWDDGHGHGNTLTKQK